MSASRSRCCMPLSNTSRKKGRNMCCGPYPKAVIFKTGKGALKAELCILVVTGMAASNRSFT
jgi:hypothetical protein